MVDPFPHAVLILQQPSPTDCLVVFLAPQLLCWGTRAAIPRMLMIFFRLFFSIRPTDPISGNAFTVNEKKRGWPYFQNEKSHGN